MPHDDEVLRANLDTAVQALIDISALADNNPNDTKAWEIARKAVTTIIARRVGIPPNPKEGYFSVTLPGPSAPHRSRWAKWVIGINSGQRGGYAFEGPFLTPGLVHSLPPWAVILQHESDRGTKLSPEIILLQVRGDGALHTVLTEPADKSWAVWLAELFDAHFKKVRGA